jgi:site-specific recombinase XerD
MIVLPRHKTVRRLKNKKPKKISLAHPEAQDLLKTIRDRGDHSDHVFVSRRRRPWSRGGLQQNVKRLRKEVGLSEEVVLYGLRHSWATRGCKNGVPIKHVSEGMGHQHTRTTEQHYVHLEDDAILHATMLQVNGLRPGV